MKIIKIIQGHEIELELDKIKSYDRFTLYQVSRVVDGVKVPLYKQCFTNLQLRKIVVSGCELNEETDYDNLDTGLTRIIDSHNSEEETYEYLLADVLEG